ncbi:hypothetical protein GCM10027347_59340 [Larkinella harenae]
MNRADLLDLAKQTVTTERTGHYGEPEDTFGLIAGFWSVYLGVTITTDQVAMMMALLKIARQKACPSKLDTYVDLAGYAACGAECAEAK